MVLLTLIVKLGPIQGESSKHTSYASSLATLWWKRKLRILQDLSNLDASIVCLQEVSHKSLLHTFIPHLKKVHELVQYLVYVSIIFVVIYLCSRVMNAPRTLLLRLCRLQVRITTAT